MPVQAVALVLRQHRNPKAVRVHKVAQYEVDEAIIRTEGHSGFRAITREGCQSLALSSGKHKT
jgi:hypothetical protein